MSDRTAEIRDLVDNYNALDVVVQMRRGSDYADAMASDIGWLLDELQRYMNIVRACDDA